VSAFLKERGRRAIVWNDGLCGNLDPEAVTQFWMPFFGESARTARRINAGGRAIMSHCLHVYYDYPYALTPLSKPTVTSRACEKSGRRARRTCSAWRRRSGRNGSIPRRSFSSTSCRAWPPRRRRAGRANGRRYPDFLRRLLPHYALYEALGLNYARFAEKPFRSCNESGGSSRFCARYHAELLQDASEARKQHKKLISDDRS
jgi:hypothetical protein